jgi:hypothetical protein
MKDSFHWYKSDYHLHKEHADLVWIYFLMLEKAKEYRKVLFDLKPEASRAFFIRPDHRPVELFIRPDHRPVELFI